MDSLGARPSCAQSFVSLVRASSAVSSRVEPRGHELLAVHPLLACCRTLRYVSNRLLHVVVLKSLLPRALQ